MKKVLIALLSLLLFFSFSSCTKQEDASLMPLTKVTREEIEALSTKAKEMQEIISTIQPEESGRIINGTITYLADDAAVMISEDKSPILFYWDRITPKNKVGPEGTTFWTENGYEYVKYSWQYSYREEEKLKTASLLIVPFSDGMRCILNSYSATAAMLAALEDANMRAQKEQVEIDLLDYLTGEVVLDYYTEEPESVYGHFPTYIFDEKSATLLYIKVYHMMANAPMPSYSGDWASYLRFFSSKGMGLTAKGVVELLMPYYN